MKDKLKKWATQHEAILFISVGMGLFGYLQLGWKGPLWVVAGALVGYGFGLVRGGDEE